MRRILFQTTIHIAVVSIALPVWAAGMRMQSETTDVATGAITKTEVLVDQTRLRLNMTGPKTTTSVLFLTDGGRDRMVMLDTTKNEYMEIDKEQMEKMARQMQGAMGQMKAMMDKMPPEQRAAMEKAMKGMPGKMPAAAQAGAKTVYTAKGSSTVNGFACKKYDGTKGAEKVMDLCAAAPGALKFAPTDFQVFNRMQEFTATMREMAANSPFGGAVDMTGFTNPAYEGIPVAQNLYVGGKMVQKTEVKSVQAASFSNADFSLGTAKKREMPQMGTISSKKK